MISHGVVSASRKLPIHFDNPKKSCLLNSLFDTTRNESDEFGKRWIATVV